MPLSHPAAPTRTPSAVEPGEPCAEAGEVQPVSPRWAERLDGAPELDLLRANALDVAAIGGIARVEVGTHGELGEWQVLVAVSDGAPRVPPPAAATDGADDGHPTPAGTPAEDDLDEARSVSPGVVMLPLRASDGHVAGGLRLTLSPPDLHLPEHRAHLVSALAHQAGLTLDRLLARGRLDEQMRLMRATREIVRGASSELELGALVQHLGPALMSGMHAVGLWSLVFGDDSALSAVAFEGDRLPEITRGADGLTARVARDAWAQQRVAVVSSERLRGGLLTPPDVAALRDFLRQTGIGSLMFVPVGVGQECLGCLVLARDVGAPVWTHAEFDAVLDLGHDLGRAVLNARTFERERDLVRRLQDLDAYRTTLMRSMAHELRSPLTAISAHVDLLEQEQADGADTGGPSSAEVAALAAGIGRGTRRMALLVDDLLLLASTGDPQLPLDLSVVDLTELVREAVELRRVQAAQVGLELRVVAPERPVEVEASAALLQIVVANLVGNAVKYSPDGGVVTVTVEPGPDTGRDTSADQGPDTGADPGADTVVLTCADEGLGMSADDQRRAFEEFFRSADPAARSQGGTGLGLSIVSQIVRRHGGTVTLDSRLGRGSTFRVVLPTHPPAAGR